MASVGYGAVSDAISWGVSKLFTNNEYEVNEMLVNDNNILQGSTPAEFSTNLFLIEIKSSPQKNFPIHFNHI